MTKINLLPWREELRKIKNNVFYALVALSVGVSLMIVFFAHVVVQHWIDNETENITLLKEEQKNTLNKITEIKNLQKDKEDLLHRLDIIQTLQENRSFIVKLLDALPRVTPEGIVLTSIERVGSQVTILGTAQTPTSISLLYKNLEDKLWNNLFTHIKINEIALGKKQTGVGFILEFTLGGKENAK